jgi:hypothetical protein
MAFVIKSDKNYNWPVTISEPMDGGGFNDQKVRVKFKMLKQARIDEIVKNEAEEDADILRDVLVDTVLKPKCQGLFYCEKRIKRFA